MNIVTIGRRASGKITPPYLMTKDTNPEVLAVCYGRGWCASPDYMTYEEAAAVNGKITSVKDLNFSQANRVTHFEELEHFVNITELGGELFRSNTLLISIKFPPNITSIGGACFFYCKNMEGEIVFPQTLKTIYGNAFRYCSKITSITMYNVTAIAGTNVFNSCTSLNAIYIYSPVPPTLANSNSFSNTGNCDIYVPAESVATYQTSANWSDLANRIKAIPT